MSKELDAWEDLKRQVGNMPYTSYENGLGLRSTFLVKDTAIFPIIENALKDYELLKSNQIFIERAKKLKTLEIIKAHPEQLLDIIDTDNYNEYLDLDYAPNQYLSEENYYLVKEVLK